MVSALLKRERFHGRCFVPEIWILILALLISNWVSLYFLVMCSTICSSYLASKSISHKIVLYKFLFFIPSISRSLTYDNNLLGLYQDLSSIVIICLKNPKFCYPQLRNQSQNFCFQNQLFSGSFMQQQHQKDEVAIAR